MSTHDEGDAVAELTARVARVELRLNDLDQLAMPLDAMGSPPWMPQPSGDQHADAASWVSDHFAATYVRPLGSQWRWCPRWVEHPEAVLRLTALWRSWERLQADVDLGMATWLREHLDPQLPVLLSATGPFSSCSRTRHELPAPLPLDSG